ncbi:MAG: ATP-binding protein [Deltaproteobacteria bacterium]|nr:ATP-binding protein [Kofleriaceae bacterium]
MSLVMFMPSTPCCCDGMEREGFNRFRPDSHKPVICASKPFSQKMNRQPAHEVSMPPPSSGTGEADRDRSRRVAVRDPLDVFVARWAVLRLAREIGFSTTAGHELAIVVSELSTNILKYGVRGEIELRRVEDHAAGVGITIVAHDEGPPLASLEAAMRDGWGDRGPIDPAILRRGGIGAGLGAVERLTDRFEYLPDGARKAFRVTRFLHRPRRPGTSPTP